MYHYVYRLDHIETKEFYIGSRTSKKHPSLDNYLGSMKTWKPDKTKLKKTILKDDFANRESAIQFEANEITKSIDEDLNRNYYIPFKGFHSVGQATVRDLEGKTFNVSVNDPRYLSGELKGATTGFCNVVDENGKNIQVALNNYKYLNGDYHGCSKNFFVAKDKNNIVYYIHKNDHRYLNGELSGISKDTLVVKDKEGNNFSVSIDDSRYLNGELVPLWKGKKHSEKTIKKYKETFKRIEHQQGQKNSQFGTCWIYRGDENKKIRKEELDYYISLGWFKGRNCSEKKERIRITKNDSTKYIKKDELNLYTANGWVKINKKLTIFN